MRALDDVGELTIEQEANISGGGEETILLKAGEGMAKWIRNIQLKTAKEL